MDYAVLSGWVCSVFAKQTTDLSAEERQKALQNRLESTFSPYIYNYSGGELFYEYLGRKYGEGYVSQFVRLLYEQPLPQSLTGIGLEVELCEKEWKEYVKTHYID